MRLYQKIIGAAAVSLAACQYSPKGPSAASTHAVQPTSSLSSSTTRLKGTKTACVHWDGPHGFDLTPLMTQAQDYWTAQGLNLRSGTCSPQELDLKISVRYLKKTSQRFADELRDRGYGGSVLPEGAVFYHINSSGQKVPVHMEATLGNMIGALQDLVKGDKVYAFITDIEASGGPLQTVRLRQVTTVPTSAGTLSEVKQDLVRSQAETFMSLLK